MKKLLFAIVLLTGLNSSLRAQTSIRHLSPFNLTNYFPSNLKETNEDHAANIANAYGNTLYLTCDQTQKIYCSILENLENPKALAAESLSKPAIDQKMYIHQELKKALKDILTYRQYLQYEQINHYPELKELTANL